MLFIKGCDPGLKLILVINCRFIWHLKNCLLDLIMPSSYFLHEKTLSINFNVLLYEAKIRGKDKELRPKQYEEEGERRGGNKFSKETAALPLVITNLWSVGFLQISRGIYKTDLANICS